MSHRLFDGLGDRPSFGDHLESLATAEQRDEALAHDFVVIDHEEAKLSRGLWVGHSGIGSRLVSGNRTMIRVPAPGWLSISMVPPIDAARSLRLDNPRCPARGAAGRVEAPPVVLDREDGDAGRGTERNAHARTAAVANGIAQRLARDLEQLTGYVDRHPVVEPVCPAEVVIDGHPATGRQQDFVGDASQPRAECDIRRLGPEVHDERPDLAD